MKNIKNLIIDMDGVLWLGDTPLPGLNNFIQTLEQANINFVFATNNAAKTPDQYLAKFQRFGITIKESQILTSAEATASYLSQKYAPATAVFVVGGADIREGLTRRGFEILTVQEVLNGRRAQIVAVGFWREVSYDDFAAAAICIGIGAEFVGTNSDATFPSEWGNLPGAGALIALLQTTTGVEPTIIGKPGPLLFQDAMKRLNGRKENTAMVGDRLNTDVAGGKAAGVQTILVLSGITTPEDLAQAKGLTPDYVFADISELAAQINQVASHG
jgi:4-nitrophenyl phosphatase